MMLCDSHTLWSRREEALNTSRWRCIQSFIIASVRTRKSLCALVHISATLIRADPKAMPIGAVSLFDVCVYFASLISSLLKPNFGSRHHGDVIHARSWALAFRCWKNDAVGVTAAICRLCKLRLTPADRGRVSNGRTRN